MTTRILLTTWALASICLAPALGQDAESVSDSPKPAYVMVEYIRVPEGGDELYLKVEQAWKKIHAARKDLGLVTGWATCRVERVRGPKSDYNYVVVHICDSWADLENPMPVAKIRERVSFSEEESQLIQKTGESRDLIRTDIWRFDTTALPERFGQTGFDKTLTVGFMKSNRPRAHLQLEQDVFRHLWAQAAKDGYRWNWSLWRCRFPKGSHRPYDLVAIHTYPSGKANYQLPQQWWGEAIRKAFPDQEPEEVGRRMSNADAVRDIVAAENWTVVQSLED